LDAALGQPADRTISATSLSRFSLGGDFFLLTSNG